MNEKYIYRGLSVSVEISTLCNARCPQCHRMSVNNSGDLETANWLKEEWLSLEKFKKWFPPETVSYLGQIQLSGTFGEPVTNPDLLDIINYIRSVSSTTKISLHTNGSLKEDDFWIELAFLGGDQLRVIFAVDGKNQKQHEMYRVNTNLDKVLRHMKLMSKYGVSELSSFTTLFKHNENDLEDILELCRKNGVYDNQYIESSRFSKYTQLSYQFKGEKRVLHQVENRRSKDTPSTLRKTRVIGLNYKEEKIVCDSLKRNKLQIYITGDVYPCCYIGTNYTMRHRYGATNNIIKTDREDEYPLLKNVINNNINLNYKSLKEILNNNYYNEFLASSVKNVNTAHRICKIYCSYGKDE